MEQVIDVSAKRVLLVSKIKLIFETKSMVYDYVLPLDYLNKLVEFGMIRCTVNYKDYIELKGDTLTLYYCYNKETQAEAQMPYTVLLAMVLLEGNPNG